MVNQTFFVKSPNVFSFSTGLKPVKIHLEASSPNTLNRTFCMNDPLNVASNYAGQYMTEKVDIYHALSGTRTHNPIV